MWTREEIKTKAKAVLRRSYWKALLVSFIISLVSGRGSNIYNVIGGRLDYDTDNRVRHGSRFVRNPLDILDSDMAVAILSIGLTVGLIIFAAVLAFNIFVTFPLQVGARRFFISLTVQDAEIGSLGFAFKSGRYMNVAKTMFMTSLFIFLWTLLFIIPGIIKGYAYSMVPYILADNPNMDYKRALELSEEMTMGEKANLWVLDLSFIGWYLLGILTCGIGFIFLQPYVDTTKAELYIVLRRKALQNKLFRPEELSGQY